MAGNEVRIAVVADDKASATLDRVDKKSSGLGGTLDGLKKNWLAVGAATGVATVALTGAGRAIIGLAGMASDLVEAQNRVDQVFGESAASVREFATTAADSLGETETAILGATGGFGSMFKAAGIAQDEAARMSVTMATLAADLGSFNNIATDEALLRLTQGLSGSTESLRTLGIFLSESAVKSKLLESGIVRQGDAIGDAEKILGRYLLTLEQTADQQGDFARTSDGLANQQKILGAKVDELKTKMGSLATGPLSAVVGKLIEITDAMDALAAAPEVNLLVRLTRVITDVRASEGDGFFDKVRTAGGAALNPLGFLAGELDVIGDVAGGIRSDLTGHGRPRFDRAFDDPMTADAVAGFEALLGRQRDSLAGRTPNIGAGGGLSPEDYALQLEKATIAGIAARNAERELRAEREEAERGTVRASDAERALASERLRLAGENTSEVIDAWFRGGQELVDITREQQEEQRQAFEEAAEGLGEMLGTSDELYRTFWDDFIEETQRGVDAAIEEEQRLSEQRMSDQARNAQALLRGFLANPEAGMNTPGLIDLINNPSLLPSSVPAPNVAVKAVISMPSGVLADLVVEGIEIAQGNGQI